MIYIRLPFALPVLLCLFFSIHAQISPGYLGKPWKDSVASIPGRVEPENYDEGLSGMTWFDTDANVGAYKDRNPSGVDLDRVKTTDQAVPGSTIKPIPNGIYWGWLVNSEWVKMTVNVKQAGTYSIHGMVGTAMPGTSFRVDAFQGVDSVSSGILPLPFTGPCPLECYHYWFYAKDLGTINLKAGVQVLRLQIVKSGYNIEWLDLETKGSSKVKRTVSGVREMKSVGIEKAYDLSGRTRAHTKGRVLHRSI